MSFVALILQDGAVQQAPAAAVWSGQRAQLHGFLAALRPAGPLCAGLLGAVPRREEEGWAGGGGMMFSSNHIIFD